MISLQVKPTDVQSFIYKCHIFAVPVRQGMQHAPEWTATVPKMKRNQHPDID